jgi:DNA-binding transcriptional ArsR family regulator
MLEAVFGSAAAEKVLLYLRSYEQAYGREIATAFGIAQSQVQKQLLKLESGGVLVSRQVGRTRIHEWNPRNPFVPFLRALLDAALDSLPDTERQRYFRRRTRPRRSGKTL